MSSQVETYRKVIKQAGDSGAGMYVTEIGAGSASGGNSLNRGTKGQAKLLKEIYKYFLKKRNKLQRRAGRLVQLAGQRPEHLLVVRELRPADRERQGEALVQGVHQAHRRQLRQALSARGA